MKQKLYDVLEVLCYIWILMSILVTFRSLSAENMDTINIVISIFAGLILCILPLKFVIWRFKVDKNIKSYKEITKEDIKKKITKIIRGLCFVWIVLLTIVMIVGGAPIHLLIISSIIFNIITWIIPNIS